jgi:hypothetical protein
MICILGSDFPAGDSFFVNPTVRRALCSVASTNRDVAERLISDLLALRLRGLAIESHLPSLESGDAERLKNDFEAQSFDSAVRSARRGNW